MLRAIKTGIDNWFRLTPTDSLYDRTLLWLYVGLMIIGLIVVGSASIPISIRLYNEPFHFAIRDAGYIVMALCIFAFFIQQPIRKWEKYNVALFFISLILLIAVLFVGKEINGAKRWIPLGIMNFQASELAKLAIICYFASFYVRRYEVIRTERWSFIRPFAVVALFIIILTAQSDLGSIFILFSITFSMLFIMGAKWQQFITLGVVAVVGFAGYVYSSEYRMKRVTAYLDPFADVYGDGFQLANSQMAFGQGEILGRGLGNSVQKLEYLPEAHTDFIMAVIGEEFGLVGILFIIFMLTCLLIRTIKISRESLQMEERFKGYFAFGIAVWIFLQGVINLGVASGLLPTKGLTFPFVSYGGSSLILLSIAMAILVRIDHENRLERIGYTRAKKN